MPPKQAKPPPLRGFPWKGKFLTKAEVDRYFSDWEGIQCLLCGRTYGTLNGHLQIVHETTHEKYRRQYGLPWRRGLVSRKVSNRISTLLTERIRSGSFTPKPDNKAAVAVLRAGLMRRDQPYFTEMKSKRAVEQSKDNVRYRPRDFGRVLAAMGKRKATLNEVCKDKNLPSKGTVLAYAEQTPSFRRKLLETYHALPYEVQARADMFSPQFFEEVRKLKSRGLSNREIGGKLGVSEKTVAKRLKGIRQ